MATVGDKVGALVSASSEEKKVNFLGWGEYLGALPIEEGLMFEGMPNPTIKLDDGNIVYGYECWWGDADKLKEKFKGYEFVPVKLERHQ